MPLELKQHRKAQTHSAYNRAWVIKGDNDFTAFSETTALAGDVWRCSADEQIVNDTVGNPVVYKGDFIIALVDNPGELNWTNINADKWDIQRKNPIGDGEKRTGVDGGMYREMSMSDDYMFVCATAGTAETTAGAGDGTAIWKKWAITAT